MRAELLLSMLNRNWLIAQQAGFRNRVKITMYEHNHVGFNDAT